MRSTGGSGLRQGKAGSLALPWDLGEWVEKKVLLEWVLEEVARLDWSNPRVEEYLARHPEYQPRMLLCVLTWAYATSCFESSEVERACVEERLLRPVCQGGRPSEREIARFRRDNRGLLRWSLGRLFRRVLRFKLGLPESFFPSGLRRYVDGHAVMRLDMARQMDRGASGF